MTRAFPALLVVAFLALTGCAEDTASGNAAEVTRAEFGSEWPLTVDRGTLSCHSAGGGAVTFTAPDGTVYWVNGHGATVPGARDIEPIWRDAPEWYAPKIDIGPLISRGLELCE